MAPISQVGWSPSALDYRGALFNTERTCAGGIPTSLLLRGASNLEVQAPAAVSACGHGHESLLGIVAEATVVGALADDHDIGSLADADADGIAVGKVALKKPH